MSSLPKVTINIPTYNQEKYIGNAIESALMQDYPNLEIIVADDLSSDNTYREAKKYESDARIKVYRNETRMKRVGNYRHMLYDLGSGEWVVNLDGDDYYSDPTFVSEGIKILQQHPGAVEYIAASKALHEDTGAIELSKVNLPEDLKVMPGKEFLLNFRTFGQVGQHFAVLYNREKALARDFYCFDALGADTDSILRLALQGDIILHKKYIGVWRSHSANASYTLSAATVKKEIEMFEHVAAEAYNYLPKAQVDNWIQQQRDIKTKESLMMDYYRLPVKQAWGLFFRKMKFNTWNLKELAKLMLRTVRLR